MSDNPYDSPESNLDAPPDSAVAVCEPLSRGTGWIKFLGIMTIIGGVLTALTITGIIVAWLPIWLGVTYLQAAGRISEGYQNSNTELLAQGNDKLRLAFKIIGITMIVYIVFFVVAFLAMGGAMIAGLAGAGG